jgi:hypothetical protein
VRSGFSRIVICDVRGELSCLWLWSYDGEAVGPMTRPVVLLPRVATRHAADVDPPRPVPVAAVLVLVPVLEVVEAPGLAGVPECEALRRRES